MINRCLPATLFLLCSLLLISCSSSTEQSSAPQSLPTPLKAVAEMQPTEGNTVQGTVVFEQANGNVRVHAEITGLEPGMHGFHIHENGDCSAPDGSSAGGHFNPTDQNHGGPDASVHHIGDLGNIRADENGNATYEATLSFLSLGDGENSILNRGLIVHALEDDLVSQPTGAAGARLACGVIRIQ